ncbi:YhfC family glutamic-type intramembrane protease [Catonella morbi]|nr:YhfC family glutamic-type intramembrane protease [Catonella morbi]
MKTLRYLYLFVLGLLSFLVSQILTRIPLLGILTKNPKFIIFQINNALLVGCLIAVSAGVFEEVFRFLFRRFLVREGVKISEPIIFGLGHSLMEIIYIFIPVILSSGLSVISSLGIIERIIATLIHIELSIIIWNGFLENKKYLYLLLAVLLHSICDILIPVAMSVGIGSYALEMLFFAVTVIIGVITLRINRMEWKL